MPIPKDPAASLEGLFDNPFPFVRLAHGVGSFPISTAPVVLISVMHRKKVLPPPPRKKSLAFLKVDRFSSSLSEDSIDCSISCKRSSVAIKSLLSFFLSSDTITGPSPSSASREFCMASLTTVVSRSPVKLTMPGLFGPSISRDSFFANFHLSSGLMEVILLGWRQMSSTIVLEDS